LNRVLIRDPKAHETLDVYSRIDEAAGAALGVVLGDSGPVFDTDSLAPRTTVSATHRINRGWWLVPGAIAAALLAFFVARIEMGSSSNQMAGSRQPPDKVQPLPIGHDRARFNQHPMRTVGDRPSVRRRTGRDVIGVVGEDGNFYWIEVDRTRTIRRPKPKSVVEF